MSASFADTTTSPITVPSSVELAPVYALATTLVGGGVALFAVRKVIKLMNRS